MTRIIMVLLAFTFATMVHAVEPDEVLADPALEARPRELSKELRCLVCRNENIDSSDAAIARDLRLFVRERLMAGDSDQAVLDNVVARYGEYALLRPQLNGTNWLLYGAGPLALLIGLGGWFASTRRKAAPEKGLTKVEQRRLAALLDNSDD